MRQRNADGHPIRFWGIDMQMTDMTESLLRMALGKDTTAVQRLDEIGPKLDKVLTYDNEYRAQIDPRLAREIAQGLDAIESRIDPSVPDAHDRAMLRQWITLIRQYLGLGEDIYWRDRCMADNLLWLRGQYPDSRIVLWAHNGHISKADDRLGRWLQDRLGADYVNFGFTFYRGRCSITVPDSEELQHDVQTAPPGTLEHLLHQLGEPIFILDLRQMREEQALALEWINGMRFRHIGALRWDNEFWDEGIADQFDYLIYIDRVTPSAPAVLTGCSLCLPTFRPEPMPANCSRAATPEPRGGEAAPNPSAQAFSFPESLPAQSQIPTIGRRGHAGRQAEQAVEMRQVVETRLGGNPRDGLIGMHQSVADPRHAERIRIFGDGASRTTAEIAAQGRR